MPSEFQGYQADPSSDDEVSLKKKPENLQSYIGCKIIQAKPMSYEQWARSQGKWQEGQETMGEGYMVVYDDGYRSWSPKSVFERCYRPITDAEKRMTLQS